MGFVGGLGQLTLYGLSSFLLLEFSLSYYVLTRKFSPIKGNYWKIKKLLLLRVSKSLVEFLGSGNLLEESIISSSLNISDEQFISYFEGKLKSIKDRVNYLNESLNVLDKFESDFRRVQTYFDEVKYLVGIALLLMVVGLLLMLVGVGGGDYYVPTIKVGISLGLEIMGIYYTILSITIVNGLKREILKSAKLKVKSNTLLDPQF